MLTRSILAVALLAFVGCNPEPPVSPPAVDPSAKVDDGDRRDTTKEVEAIFAASPGRDRHIASWDFVCNRADLTGKVDYDNSPISLKMQLADSPLQWSTATGERIKHGDNDEATLRIALAGFVFDLTWEPVKDAFTKWTNGDEMAGTTDMLQWEITDESDETHQRIKMRFRIPPESN